LRVIANRSHAKGLVTNIGEYVENRPKDPVYPDRVQLLACCCRNFLSQLFRPRGCQAHGAWELADVDFIVEAVDTSILLVKRNGQGYWMAGIMRDGLKIEDQLSCLLGSCIARQ
jgi:hypothetical protein